MEGCLQRGFSANKSYFPEHSVNAMLEDETIHRRHQSAPSTNNMASK